MTTHQQEVTQLQTTVYGVEGNGGLVRKVDEIEARVDEHEQKLGAVSLKWLILMLLAGAVGNSIGSTVLAHVLDTLKTIP